MFANLQQSRASQHVIWAGRATATPFILRGAVYARSGERTVPSESHLSIGTLSALVRQCPAMPVTRPQSGNKAGGAKTTLHFSDKAVSRSQQAVADVVSDHWDGNHVKAQVPNRLNGCLPKFQLWVCGSARERLGPSENVS
jgi:hypothetical protein